MNSNNERSSHFLLLLICPNGLSGQLPWGLQHNLGGYYYDAFAHFIDEEIKSQAGVKPDSYTQALKSTSSSYISGAPRSGRGQETECTRLLPLQTPPSSHPQRV